MSFQNARIKATAPEPSAYFTQPEKRGEIGFEVSSSMLKEASRCLARWRDGYESPESRSKVFGSLLDCLLLTPEQFESRYAVQPETYVNEKGEEKEWHHAAKACKAWKEENADKEIVSPGLIGDARAAIEKLRKDPVIASFIDSSEKQVWVAGEWLDEHTGLVIPVKCLIDLVPRSDSPFAKNLGDLKTARNAGLAAWTRQVFDMGYHVQGAFNFDLYRAARPDEDRCNFCFVVQENYAPWQTGKRILSEAFLELGRATYRRALANYALCLKRGVWPGYDDTDEAVQSWSITEPTPWMESDATFAPKVDFGDENSPEETPVEEGELVP